MIPAKIKLSDSELSLVCDADFILTKNRIIEKVYMLFGVLSEELRSPLQTMQRILPPEIYSYSPKIYRGEKYRKLPYVMLDYPRCFINDGVFAIRFLFWWGNQFSITLHLGGKYAEQYTERILHNVLKKNDDKWFICIGKSQWEHHFEPDNFIQVANISADAVLKTVCQNGFIKIAQKLPLEQWNNALLFFTEINKDILNLFIKRIEDYPSPPVI